MNHGKRTRAGIIGFAVSFALILSGCQLLCDHQWTAATCETPKTCSLCGKTDGDPNGHRWQAATCEAPQTCLTCALTEGERIEHNWKDATCTEPYTCSLCGEEKGLPYGHTWKDATCVSPMQCEVCESTTGAARGHDWELVDCEAPYECSRCSATGAEPPGHSWVEATADTPRMCAACRKMEPLPLPMNGQVFIGEYLPRGSELTIHAPVTDSCYVKLKDIYKNDVFAFFVQAGTTVQIEVPQGYYYPYFASGDEWYGTQYAFGASTYYAKDDTLLDFNNYTYTYTLYSVENGNVAMTEIDEEEF